MLVSSMDSENANFEANAVDNALLIASSLTKVPKNAKNLIRGDEKF